MKFNGSIVASANAHWWWPTWVSFDETAAVVTGAGLVVGRQTAHSCAARGVGAPLIIGVADNFMDSSGVHAYRESEDLSGKAPLRSTLANFLACIGLTLTFCRPRNCLAAPSGFSPSQSST